MNNCLLCANCTDDSESVDGYPINPYYVCWKRENIHEDGRFPYKNTKCRYFEKDHSLVNLIVKGVSKEVFDKITWEVS